MEEDEDTSWFQTPAWQAKEREADEDIRLDRVKRFASAEALLADLHRDWRRPTTVQVDRLESFLRDYKAFDPD